MVTSPSSVLISSIRSRMGASMEPLGERSVYDEPGSEREARIWALWAVKSAGIGFGAVMGQKVRF